MPDIDKHKSLVALAYRYHPYTTKKQYQRAVAARHITVHAEHDKRISITIATDNARCFVGAFIV